MTLSRCANSGDALSCAAITRTPSGLISRINAQLQNIGSIRTRGIDVTLNYKTPKSSVGMFGLSVNGNYLLKYTETFPAQIGFTTTEYRETTRGFPDQSYPKLKLAGIIDWSLGTYSASFTGRYINGVVESNGNQLASRFYSDVQVTFGLPGMKDRAALTLGVNNVFNQDPPPCFTCTGPNFDPTTYDVPGQFGYIRLTYKM